MLRTLLVIVMIGGAGATALAKTPTHKSIAVPHAAAPADCLDSSRLFSHVAFTNTAVPHVKSCSQLLSTDTLIAIRHWGRT